MTKVFDKEPVRGYKALSQYQIDMMNHLAEVGARLGELIQELEENKTLDQRWINIGAIDLQRGLMSLRRGVAKPDTF